MGKEKNKIMIISAHPDDTEFGMGGTAAKLSQDHDVYQLILCKGNRPGCESVETSRFEAVIKNSKELGFIETKIKSYSDVTLDTIPSLELNSVISTELFKIKPNIVYTHCQYDIHKDHRIVSRAVRVVTRPRKDSTVKELYEFTIPGSTEWGLQVDEFNVFEDITHVANIKMKCVNRYSTELRPSPDPCSPEQIDIRDRYHGSLCGYNKAEIFKLVYKR